MSRKGRICRRFTSEEDARLVELRLQYPGYDRGKWRSGCRGGLRTIAKIMGRTHSSIQVRLRMLAERDDETE